MELDEMKRLWAESNRRLEASVRLNVLLMQQWNLRKVDTSLARLKRGLTLELVVSVIAIGALAHFGYQHAREPRFLIPAVALYLYALGYLIAVARQLGQMARLDYDEPVITIQKKLEGLRLARVRTTLWTLLFGPLMWLPILVVGMRGIFGVDVYAFATPAWLASNVLFGLAVIPLAIFLARRFGPRQAAEILEHALDLVSKLPAVQRAELEVAILERSAAICNASLDSRAIDPPGATAGMIQPSVRRGAGCVRFNLHPHEAHREGTTK